jgi:uncharacterized protein YqeY
MNPSTSPQSRLEDDVRTALKAGDKERVSTLRMLLAEVKNEALKGTAEVGEEAFVGLVRKAIKRRQEATALYRQGGRPELADKEEREAVVLEDYLPQQVSEAEIRAAVDAWLESPGVDRAAGPALMGAAMKALKERFGASADGATLSRVVRESLAVSAGAAGAAGSA